MVGLFCSFSESDLSEENENRLDFDFDFDGREGDGVSGTTEYRSRAGRDDGGRDEEGGDAEADGWRMIGSGVLPPWSGEREAIGTSI